ncbi:envelope glycoprotein N [Cervid alphaherpesvirus 3]|uniref:Envelope glycoprotein N n=1 Tax=Cervid alphaherpesvirus 3 TaxID=2115790 RepID=A0A455JNH1_9ALPH|nr:envelope glycoprotein N [Cervid alphaherpesvirus 3]AVT50600.1 envelope glycoprotein N [Cervid alphaherpesvirus 3]
MPRPLLSALAAAALLAIAGARDPLLDAMRHEGAMDFWSASCYARGVPLSEPPQALVVFYAALAVVMFSVAVYAYGLCLRLVGADPPNKKDSRGRG